MHCAAPTLYCWIVLTKDLRTRLDRRQTPRFRVVLPVTLEDGTAWTRDVSASGVYLKLFARPQHLPLEGSRIKLDLVLEHVNRDGPVKVVCQGEILRVEHAPAYVGMAVRINPCDVDARQMAGAAYERRGADREGGNKDAKCNPVPPPTVDTAEMKLAVGSGRPPGERASASLARSSTPAARPRSASRAKAKRSASGRGPAPPASALAPPTSERAKPPRPTRDRKGDRPPPDT
jgi:hypothetical protein